jgi:protein CpxP
MKKLLLSLTVASLLSTSAFAINAKQKEHHGDHERAMMKSLSLSEQQKEDIKQIRKETMQDLSVYREEKKQFRDSMRAIMESDTWDEARVIAAIEQQMTLSLQSKLIQAKSKNKVFNQLNDEQKAKFIAKSETNKGNKKAKNPDRKMQRLIKALSLDTEQQAQLSVMMEANKAQRSANKSQIEDVKLALRSIVQASEFDENAWLAVHADNKQQKLDMAVNKAKTRFDMLSVLSTEQRAKFAKIMKKNKKGKMKKHRGERKGRGEASES